MSTLYTRLVSCPKCAAAVDVRLAQGIHAPRREDLRTAILAREFHRVRCEHCDSVLEIEQQVVYTDFERRHWIYCCTEADRAIWPAWEARLHADVARIFTVHAPAARELATRLRARLVFGYEELREKLVVWDAGFDDALVECLKLRALVTSPALVAEGAHLVVERIGADDAVELRDTRTGKLFGCPPAWIADLDLDRSQLARRFPDLFGDGYINSARLL